MMSQLTAPTHTAEDRIPLWLRIREIMKEKGSSYSITAMAARLGISRETLRLMLSGEREIYRFELEKIAQDLKVPLRRLLQEDMAAYDVSTFKQLVAENRWEEALRLAEERLKSSIGLSERAYSFSKIIYIHFWKGDLQAAKRFNQQLYDIAIEINEKYREDTLLKKALRNMVNISADLNDDDTVREMLKIGEPYFRQNPIEMGLVYYSLSRMKYTAYEPTEGKMYLYKCLEQFMLTTDHDKIARGYINVAYAEFGDQNYKKAKEMLQGAIQTAQTDTVRLLAVKDMAKTMIKLGEHTEAAELLRVWLDTEQAAQSPDIKARLLILLSKATGNVRYAEGVAANLRFAKSLRYLAYRYLTILNKQAGSVYRAQKNVPALKGRLPKRSYPLDKNF